MVQRKTLRVDDHCEILVTTEQLADGWGVVASVKHVEGGTERVTDLPVPSQQFPSESDAEAFGVAQAREWIEENMPRAT